MITEFDINNKIDQLLELGDFGSNFSFRPQQRDTIVRICHNILNNDTKNIIVNAPTGSGKSIIAIVSSRILTKAYKLKGYIITSDLGLQDQYWSDISQFGYQWGTMKGADNYICSENNQTYVNAECKSRNIFGGKLRNLACFKECSFHNAKEKAINSPLTLVNYSYWLIQRNYTAKKEAGNDTDPSFPIRDFCFFDEAHKVDDIVQNHFSPRLNVRIVDAIGEVSLYFKENGFISTPISTEGIMGRLKQNVFDTTKTTKEDIISLTVFKKRIEQVQSAQEDFKTYITSKYPFGNPIPKNINKIIRLLDFLKDVHCKIEDYLDMTKEQHIVKTVGFDEAVFNSLDDRMLIKKVLHDECATGVFMSATFGSVSEWAEITNTIDYDRIIVKVDWDYQRSPIHLLKGPRLNYANKEESLPPAIELLDDCISKHITERGLIHTGSYGFMQSILESSKYFDRFVFYNDSAEKKDALERFGNSENKILIGPSLVEGIDLKDDLCRFQIFFKVPYRNLSCEYTKRKLKLDPRWYNYKALTQFKQGVGRGVRNDNDWAVTYLIDGCFQDFIRRNLSVIDRDILERIR
jgi:ATP-dependent DNA helicase DinG